MITEQVDVSPIVLLENRDLVAIHKPAGMSVHKDEGDVSPLHVMAQQLNVDKLYLVHRLDKLTSGVLLLAKTKRAAAELACQFAAKTVEKYYIALSDQKPKKKQGWVKGDMQKSRRGGWRLTKTMANPAITRFSSASIGAQRRLFIVRPYTGKTHQIRVALKSNSSPVIGDPIYGRSGSSGADQPDRMYLHALGVRLTCNHTLIQVSCLPSTGTLFLDTSCLAQLEAIETQFWQGSLVG